MKRLLIIALFALLASLPGLGQVFDCGPTHGTAWSTSSGVCEVGILGPSGPFKVVGQQNGSSPSLTSGSILFATGSDHVALSLMYQTAVDIRAFSTTFTFVPNGQNIAFTINNCADNGNTGYGTCGGSNLASFSSGASCEGGFSQAFSPNPFPYNVFALMFDSYGVLPAGGGTFGYSNVQIYQQNQSPCNPSSGGVLNSITNKFSTSPVPLNSPSGTQNTSTGDTYSSNLVYDGSTLTLNLCDTTVNGSSCQASCPTNCFIQTWSNVSIPSQIDSTTGYIGLVLSTGLPSSSNLDMSNWAYTVNSATAHPGSTVTSAGAPTATNPTFSPVAGTYTGTQTVTITSSGSSNICYMLAAASATIMPIADQNGGCGVGTSISSGSTVSVSSSQTLYATAGLNNTGLSSGVVQGAFTINASAGSNSISSGVTAAAGVTLP